MRYIKVWCEYDMNGQFGGNSNEEVFAVPDSMPEEEIKDIVLKELDWIWNDVKEENEEAADIIEAGLAGWEYITIQNLGS
jgi:hypothetical protein